MHKKLFRSSPTRGSRNRSRSQPKKPTDWIKGSGSTKKSKSRSLDRTNETRRNPISFHIRDKRENNDNNSNSTSTSTSNSNSNSIGHSQTYHIPEQSLTTSTAFDPWGSGNSPQKEPTVSPTSVTETYFLKREKPKSQFTNQHMAQYNVNKINTTKNYNSNLNSNTSNVKSSNSYPSSKSTKHSTSSYNHTKVQTYKNKYNNYDSDSSRKSSTRIIPGVSKMTMRQTLAIIFSAFWERADLYTDVLALEHDKPTPRQLRLAFFRQGRKVLATPIESPDDMTTLSSGMKPIFVVGGGTSNCNYAQEDNGNVVQSGVKVSRKAKMKFQAINLAYDLLNDEAKRKLYDEWRLWHSRLPPPLDHTHNQSQSYSHSTLPRQMEQSYNEENKQYQTLTNAELNEIIKGGSDGKGDKSGTSNKNRYYQRYNSQYSSNDESSTVESTSNSKITLPSILKEPTFGKKKKKKRQAPKSNKYQYGYGAERKITWNEEVEELVIMECSREYDHDSHVDLYDCTKENIEPIDNVNCGTNIPDPYLNSSIKDKWFGSETDALPEYQDDKSKRKGKKKEKKFDSKKYQNSLASKADADSLEPGPVSFNFHSLDDSTVTFVDSTQPIPTSNEGRGTLDDSLVEILDSPTQSKTSQKFSQSKEEKEKGNSSPNLVDENSFYVEGKKSNVRINVRSYKKDIVPKQTYQNVPSPDVGDIFQRHREATAYELDPEDMSIDTRSTKETQDSNNWKGYGHHYDNNSCGPTNDCSVFGSANECIFRDTTECSSVDLGKGFQATLSNYINAAVSDMKEGLNNLGKKWEEKKSKFSENGENPFLLNSFELDAMMDILKVEMNNISPTVVNDMKSFNSDCGAQVNKKNLNFCTS